MKKKKKSKNIDRHGFCSRPQTKVGVGIRAGFDLDSESGSTGRGGG